MSEKFELSKQSGPHYKLSQLAGQWEGIAKTWFEPGEPVDASPASGTFRPILGERFMLLEYKGSFQGKPLEGLAIYGYHLDLQKYQCAWVDSFHNGTAIMLSEGKKGVDNIAVLGSYAYVAPDIEQHWGWRTELEMPTADEIKITAYNISPEGEEALATQTIFSRVK